MNFPKADSFPLDVVKSKIMGPNPLKLEEELLEKSAALFRHERAIRPGSVVLDLGSGTGITSVMLAREYGLVTYAADLWSDPTENMHFFEDMGLGNRQVIPVKADATQGLFFAHEFFDAIVSIDSYNYFGRDPEYLDENLLPYLKRDGLLLVAIPGMKQDCHNNLPACLLESWTPEQLDYMHDALWWRDVFEQSHGAEILLIEEMTCTREAWTDWLQCDNEYARGDNAAIRAGALEYLNSLAIVLRKK